MYQKATTLLSLACPPSLTAVDKALARQEAKAWQAESTEVF
jgi:hypothetical protein